MPVRAVTVNGEVVNFIPDPRHRHLVLVGGFLREGDVIILTDDDGGRRHYRVNDRQRLPAHVHLEPHVTLFRTEPPPPPPPDLTKLEEEPAREPAGPNVWERLRKPLLS